MPLTLPDNIIERIEDHFKRQTATPEPGGIVACAICRAWTSYPKQIGHEPWCAGQTILDAIEWARKSQNPKD